MPTSDLASALGHPGDRLVIVHARELGLCHAANDGVYDALTHGCATSTSLMVPAPWAREAASRYRGEDVGVELTVNAEHPLYRWGPVTHAPSLLGGDGGFPADPADVWEHADTDDLRREARAQIERAVLWGFDVSHLHVHLGTLFARPELFDVVLDLAVDFGLPLTAPDTILERELGYPLRRLAAAEGVIVPDHAIDLNRAVGRAEGNESRPGNELGEVIAGLEPGVTMLCVSPAHDRPELRSLSRDWAPRVADLERVMTGSALDRALNEAGIVRIGYRVLRELQRDVTAPRRPATAI